MPKFHPGVSHYEGKIEPIDFMEENFTAEEYVGFLKGNIIKYVSRFNKKGNPKEDLKKADIYFMWLKEFILGEKIDGKS